MSRMRDYQISSLTPGSMEDVFVGHITDPDNFYVQLARTADSLEDIMHILTSHYKDSAPEGRHWQLGEACAALYTDGEWYRGRVTGTPHNKERLEVSFVDYGNKDYIETENIRQLSPDLFAFPVQSFRCCLEGVSSSENFWSPEYVAKFEDLVLEKDFAAKINSYDENLDVYYVQLTSEDGTNVNRKFGEMTNTTVVQASPGPAKRSVQAPDAGLDLKVTVGGGGSQRGRGIAQSLGVKENGGAPPQSSIPPVSLKAGEGAQVMPVFVTSPAEFWCHVTRFAAPSAQLGEQMAATYSRMGPGEGILHNLRPGSVCAALCDADQTWYRAVIEKVSGPTANVFFLDYGNTDTVAVGNVKELREGFRSLPAQAMKCGLAGVDTSAGAWSEDASAIFEDLVMEKEFAVTVLDKDHSGRHSVRLTEATDRSDVATKFLGACREAVIATSKPSSAGDAAPNSSSLAKFPSISLQMPSKAEVFISWMESPGEFYVQLVETQSVLDSLTDGLHDFYENGKGSAAVGVQTGSMVVSKFSDDGGWYRAVVKEISGPTSVVEFVDFGNSDKAPTADLQKVEKQFSKIPAQALRCSLHGVRPLSQGATWNGDARDFLERLTQEKTVCKFLSAKGGVHEVELESQGKSIAAEMVAAAVVRGLQDEGGSAPRFQGYQAVSMETGGRRKAYMGFIDGVENFFVQLADSMPKLDDLMVEMEDFYNAGKGKPLTNPQVGVPCAAKFEEDDQWYRAQVQSFSSKDIDVFFVDYGNCQSSPRSSVFQMEAAFLKSLPAQAVRCRLKINSAFNPERQVEQFTELTGQDELEVVLEEREGGKFVVDLLKQGVSISAQMTGASPRESPDRPRSGYTQGKISPGQTMSAFASFIESPSRFWVQLAGCDDELTSMMETLSKHYHSGTEAPLSNPSSGQPCVALYEEDKKWYRASVMSLHGTEVKVQFVDYGNSELVDHRNIKPISPGFMSSPLLAIECCLDGFQSCSATDDAILLLEDLVTEQELSVTFKGPKNVSVSAGNKDVGQAMRDKGFGPAATKASSPNPKGMSPAASSNPRSPPSQPSFGGGRPAFGASSPPSGGGGGSAALPQKFKEGVPPSGSAEAIITHLDSGSGKFYVQLLSAESQLQQLASKLQATYGSGGPPLRGPPSTGAVCCAKFSTDGCWYRSLIESVAGPKVKVQFVDYGNSDMVPSSSLKAVTPDLLTAPVQVFSCKLKGLDSWNNHMAGVFSKTALDERLNVRFMTTSPPYQIQVSVSGQDLMQLLLKSPVNSPQKPFGGGGGGGGRSAAPSPQKPFGAREGSKPFDSTQQRSNNNNDRFGSGPPPAKSFNDRPPQRGFTGPGADADSWGDGPANKTKPSFNRNTSSDSGMPSTPSPSKVPEQVFQTQSCPNGAQAAYVSHVAEDGTFYLQLLKDIDAIDELTAKVEKAASAAHPNPKVGAACGAKFSEDGAWYRGRITSLSGSSAEVLFVDFGNGEKSQVGGLKPLPEHLLTPPLAFQCQVEETGLLTQEQQEAFKSASEDKEYQVTFKSGNPFPAVIKDEKGVNLAETVFKPTSVRVPTAPKDSVRAMVSQVCENGQFYIQLCSEEDDLATLSDDLQDASGEDKLSCFDVGQVCCAKFTEDEAWYRASVLKDNGSTVTVLFVDFGNQDTVSKEDALVLSPSLMLKPAFAYDCKLQGVTKWKEEHRKKFEAMTDGKVMNARFLSFKPPFDVELTRSIGLELMDEDESVEDEAVEDEFTDAKETPEEAEVASQSAAPPPPAAAVSQEKSEASPASETPTESDTAKPSFPSQTPPALDACMISHIDTDGVFYIQLSSDDDSREALSDKLQDECEAADCEIQTPSVGVACCAKFSEDEAWYRAVVEKVDGDKAEVRFVDFGNTDLVPVTDLRQLSAVSLSTAPLAFRCQLDDCEAALVSSKLEDLTAEQTLTVTFTTTESPPFSVNLQLENGTNISTLLATGPENKMPPADTSAENEDSTPADDGDRKCVALAQGRRSKVTVSHVNSPSSFYVQRDDKLTAIEELCDAMCEHYSGLAKGEGIIDTLAVDQLCASSFGEDEDVAWYRAVVTNIDAENCSLLYVDYGNTASVPTSSVLELSAEFKVLPWQCMSCSLAGVGCQGEDWSEEVTTAFEELAAGKSLLADVLSGNGVDQPYLLKVLDLGISLAESLLALNLPGVEARETPKLDNVQRIFSETKSEASFSADLKDLEESAQDVTENGIEKDAEEVENSEKETVDDVGENEQEFSRHLKECTAQIESTMLEDAVNRQRNVNSTQLEESVSNVNSTQLEVTQEEEEEEEEDFEDAVDEEEEEDVKEKEHKKDNAVNSEEDVKEKDGKDDAVNSEEEEEDVKGDNKKEEDVNSEEEEEEDVKEDDEKEDSKKEGDVKENALDSEEEEDVKDVTKEKEVKESALDSDTDSEEEVGNVTVHEDHQPTFSCVSDGLAELQWMDVHVCVPVSASEFWCQLPSARETLSGSTVGLQRAQTAERVSDIKTGNLYLLCDPPQTNCRARVVSQDCADRDMVTTVKVDYGTEDDVLKTCLFPLSRQQLELPAQAFCCCLDDGEHSSADPDWFNDVIAKGEAVDLDLEVKVVGRKVDGTLLVDVREKKRKAAAAACEDSTREEGEEDSDEAVEASMEALEISQPVLESTALGDTLSQSHMDRSQDDKEYSVEALKPDKEYHVTVAPGGRPDSFYVLRDSACHLLATLADDIAAEVKDKKDGAPSQPLAVGTLCLALDQATSKWVRGQVKSAGDSYKVLCVDAGTEAECGRGGVRELPAQFLDLPVQAVHCCLADILPVEETWCEGATTFFTDFIKRSPLKLTVTGRSSDSAKCLVTLSDEQSPSDELSPSEGDLTRNQIGTEPSVNLTLVELGYAEAVSGSPLDIELQVERTINDPEAIEQMEASFSEVSCLKENSIGEVSGSGAEDHDNTEKDNGVGDDVDASGDATKAFQTESSDETPFGLMVCVDGELTSTAASAMDSTAEVVINASYLEEGATNESAHTTFFMPSIKDTGGKDNLGGELNKLDEDDLLGETTNSNLGGELDSRDEDDLLGETTNSLSMLDDNDQNGEEDALMYEKADALSVLDACDALSLTRRGATDNEKEGGGMGDRGNGQCADEGGSGADSADEFFDVQEERPVGVGAVSSRGHVDARPTDVFSIDASVSPTDVDRDVSANNASVSPTEADRDVSANNVSVSPTDVDTDVSAYGVSVSRTDVNLDVFPTDVSVLPTEVDTCALSTSGQTDSCSVSDRASVNCIQPLLYSAVVSMNVTYSRDARLDQSCDSSLNVALSRDAGLDDSGVLNTAILRDAEDGLSYSAHSGASVDIQADKATEAAATMWDGGDSHVGDVESEDDGFENGFEKPDKIEGMLEQVETDRVSVCRNGDKQEIISDGEKQELSDGDKHEHLFDEDDRELFSDRYKQEESGGEKRELSVAREQELNDAEKLELSDTERQELSDKDITELSDKDITELSDAEVQELSDRNKQVVSNADKREVFGREKQELFDTEEQELSNIEKQEVLGREKQELFDADEHKLSNIEKQEVSGREKKELFDTEEQELSNADKREVYVGEKQELSDTDKQEVFDANKQELSAADKQDLSAADKQELSDAEIREFCSDGESTLTADSPFASLAGSAPADTEPLLSPPLSSSDASDVESQQQLKTCSADGSSCKPPPCAWPDKLWSVALTVPLGPGVQHPPPGSSTWGLRSKERGGDVGIGHTNGTKTAEDAPCDVQTLTDDSGRVNDNISEHEADGIEQAGDYKISELEAIDTKRVDDDKVDDAEPSDDRISETQGDDAEQTDDTKQAGDDSAELVSLSRTASVTLLKTLLTAEDDDKMPQLSSGNNLVEQKSSSSELETQKQDLGISSLGAEVTVNYEERLTEQLDATAELTAKDQERLTEQLDATAELTAKDEERLTEQLDATAELTAKDQERLTEQLDATAELTVKDQERLTEQLDATAELTAKDQERLTEQLDATAELTAKDQERLTEQLDATAELTAKDQERLTEQLDATAELTAKDQERLTEQLDATAELTAIDEERLTEQLDATAELTAEDEQQVSQQLDSMAEQERKQEEEEAEAQRRELAQIISDYGNTLDGAAPDVGPISPLSPGQENESPRQENGSPGQENGLPGRENGSTGRENGSPGRENGSTGQENRSTGSENGSTGSKKDSTGSENRSTGLDVSYAASICLPASPNNN